MNWLTVFLLSWMGSTVVLLLLFRGLFGEGKKLDEDAWNEPSSDDYWNDGWVSDQGDRAG